MSKQDFIGFDKTPQAQYWRGQKDAFMHIIKHAAPQSYAHLEGMKFSASDARKYAEIAIKALHDYIALLEAQKESHLKLIDSLAQMDLEGDPRLGLRELP